MQMVNEFRKSAICCKKKTPSGYKQTSKTRITDPVSRSFNGSE